MQFKCTEKYKHWFILTALSMTRQTKRWGSEGVKEVAYYALGRQQCQSHSSEDWERAKERRHRLRAVVIFWTASSRDRWSYSQYDVRTARWQNSGQSLKDTFSTILSCSPKRVSSVIGYLVSLLIHRSISCIETRFTSLISFLCFYKKHTELQAKVNT